ncbi:MAG: tetraacyldisaccharide 4'-kinase [Pseudomonadota bacterium]
MAQLVRDFLYIILLPLSWLYSLGVFVSLKAKRIRDPGFPVISVGNIHSGGTGKTPIVIQLANYFKDRKVVILSRGYKSQSTKRGAKLDRQSLDGPRRFGDEPWMISQYTPCDLFVGADRFKVIKQFNIASDYGLAILDDGYQHVQLGRSVNLLILPGDENPWEAACLPLGSLRESFSAIKRATHIVITCSDPASTWVQDWREIAFQISPSIFYCTAKRRITFIRDGNGKRVDSSQGPFGVFCGIGRPKRFLDDLSAWAPMNLSKTFPDHYGYSFEEVCELVKKAKEYSIQAFVTTAKDFYKVSHFFKELQFPLLIAEMEYELPDEFWLNLNDRIERAC